MLNLINGSDVFAGPDLFALQNRMRRLLDPHAGWSEGETEGTQRGYWMPQMDVVEDAESYRIYAELPGVAKDHVTITVENNTLTIRGEKPEVSENEARVHRSERAFGTFERSFTLPSTADVDSITATHRDGVLTVSLRKTERAVARQIPVSTS